MKISIVLFICSLVLVHDTARPGGVSSSSADTSPGAKNGKDTMSVQLIAELQNDIRTLQQLLNRKLPRRPYLIVNTAANELRLLNRDSVIHRADCSTGSYILLKTRDKRQWLFKTPRGKFRVTVKLRDPVWYKPDWAFIEEGNPIPSKDSPDRYQYGALGDYAVAFGRGYLIHGTLYKKFLGLPVTHGCVRLADDDMYKVYSTLSHGSKIFIY